MICVPDSSVCHRELWWQGCDDLSDSMDVDVLLVRVRGIGSGVDDQIVVRPASTRMYVVSNKDASSCWRVKLSLLCELGC